MSANRESAKCKKRTFPLVVAPPPPSTALREQFVVSGITEGMFLGSGQRYNKSFGGMERLVAFNLKAFLTKVDGGKTLATYRKGETVFAQGDRCEGVFYIQSGECKVSVTSEEGKEAVVALHEKGDFFGEGCLNGQPRRLATVTAMSDLKLMRFDNTAIQRVLHEEPDFSEFFISYLLARTARVEADLVDQLFNSSEKRLARLLLLMANFGKEGKPEPVIAKISQETLAEMIGTTRSRVSTFMNKFRKLGFIEYNGDLKVHNSLLNVVLHDAPELRRAPEDA